jgi:hypothetical protein
LNLMLITIPAVTHSADGDAIKGIFMREIIQQVVERADISEDSAARAVDVVLGYLREKLPSPIATQVEACLGGEGGLSGASVVSGVSSMLGGFKKE